MENKGFSLKDVLKALSSKQENKPGVSVPEPTGTVPKGRGALVLARLQSTLAKRNTLAAPLKPYVGSNGEHKSVISNAVPILSSYLFEYEVTFHPELESERRRATFMQKYCGQLGQPYFNTDSSIYVPCSLEEKLEFTLFNQRLQKNVSLKLQFKQRKDLSGDLCLLDKIVGHLNEVKLTKVSGNMRGRHVYSMRQCKGGPMLCVDWQYFLVHAKDIAKVFEDYSLIYGDKARDALIFYLKKGLVLNELDGNLYKFDQIVGDNLARLVSPQGHAVDVPFDLCHSCNVLHYTKPHVRECPYELMPSLKELLAQSPLQLGPFVTAKARLLPPETITFGDGVTFIPKSGTWKPQMHENTVLTPVELWCWLILYMQGDEHVANQMGSKIMSLQEDTGLSISRPMYFPIEHDTKNSYLKTLGAVIDKMLQFVIVLTPRSENRPEMLVKHVCFVQKPVPCQIISYHDALNRQKLHETVLQVNAMLGGSLWAVSFPFKNWLICGVNIHRPLDPDLKPVCAFVATFYDDATQWYSKAFHLKNDDFGGCLEPWLIDTLKKYRSTNGVFPVLTVIYHVCTEDTKNQICDNYKNFQFDACAKQLAINTLNVCVILVQRDSNVSYYKNLQSGYQNVPLGTVVDDTLTSRGACDFFLVSYQASDHEVARPTYYNVIKDTSSLSPDDVQSLTYKLCHLYYKHAWSAEMPAPCMYAKQLSILVAETTQHIPSPVLDEFLYYL